MKTNDYLMIIVGVIFLTASIIYELTREVVDFRNGYWSIVGSIFLIAYPFIKNLVVKYTEGKNERNHDQDES